MVNVRKTKKPKDIVRRLHLEIPSTELKPKTYIFFSFYYNRQVWKKKKHSGNVDDVTMSMP